jgi:hypothetical protein
LANKACLHAGGHAIKLTLASSTPSLRRERQLATALTICIIHLIVSQPRDATVVAAHLKRIRDLVAERKLVFTLKAAGSLPRWSWG